MAIVKKSHFEPNVTFTSLKALSAIIHFCAGVAIIEIVFTTAILFLTHWELLHRNAPTAIFTNPIFNWYLINEDLFALLFVGGLIVFLIWFYQAYRNLYALDQETATTPGIVLVGCIIPIANLREPYIRMRELWQKVVDPAQWQLVKLWWAALVVGSISYYVPQLLFPDADREIAVYGKDFISIISVSTFFYTVSALSLIAFFLFTLKLVHTITQVEEEKLKTLPAKRNDHTLAVTPDSETQILAAPQGIGSKIMLGSIVLVVALTVLVLLALLIDAFSRFD